MGEKSKTSVVRSMFQKLHLVNGRKKICVGSEVLDLGVDNPVLDIEIEYLSDCEDEKKETVGDGSFETAQEKKIGEPETLEELKRKTPEVPVGQLIELADEVGEPQEDVREGTEQKEKTDKDEGKPAEKPLQISGGLVEDKPEQNLKKDEVSDKTAEQKKEENDVVGLAAIEAKQIDNSPEDIPDDVSEEIEAQESAITNSENKKDQQSSVNKQKIDAERPDCKEKEENASSNKVNETTECGKRQKKERKKSLSKVWFVVFHDIFVHTTVISIRPT